MPDRLMATRQSIDLLLTDAFIDANRVETLDGVEPMWLIPGVSRDGMDKNGHSFTPWTG